MSPLVKVCVTVCLLPLYWLALMACQAKRIETVLPFRPYEAVISVVDQRLWPIRRASVTVRGHRGEVWTDRMGEVRIYPVTQPLAIHITRDGYASDQRWIQGPGRYRVVLYRLASTDP